MFSYWSFKGGIPSLIVYDFLFEIVHFINPYVLFVSTFWLPGEVCFLGVEIGNLCSVVMYQCISILEFTGIFFIFLVYYVLRGCCFVRVVFLDIDYTRMASICFSRDHFAWRLCFRVGYFHYFVFSLFRLALFRVIFWYISLLIYLSYLRSVYCFACFHYVALRLFALRLFAWSFC